MSRRRPGLVLTFALLLSGPGPAATAEPPLLRPGGTATGTVSPEEVVHYRLDLEADQYLRITVLQDGTDVTTTLSGPGGEALAVADRNLSTIGVEWLEAVTEEPGTYDLKVAASSFPRPAGSYEVRFETLRPATAEDSRLAEAFRIFSRGAGLLGEEGSESRKVLLEDAAERFAALGRPLYEAEAWSRLGDPLQWVAAGEPIWRRAADLFRQAGDAPAAARAQNALAGILLLQALPVEAEEQYRLSLDYADPLTDRARRIIALLGLGPTTREQGQVQAALDFLSEALQLSRQEEPHFRAQILHELGVLHRWNLHQPSQAISYFEEALGEWNAALELQLPNYEARFDATQHQLAQAYLDLGDLGPARELLETSPALQRPRTCRAISPLTKLARLEQMEDAPVRARSNLLQAEQLLQQSCPREESSVWLAYLDHYLAQEAPKDALRTVEKCSQVFQARGDHLGAAVCQEGRARALGMQGKLQEALAASRQALEAFEEARTTLQRSDLRASFFSGAQSTYDAHVALLLDLGEDRLAFEAAERARARAFRDRLQEAGAGIRGDAPEELLRRERSLQQRLNYLDSKLRRAEPDSPQAKERTKDLEQTLHDLETVRGEIRRQAPQYDRLVRGVPTDSAEIQAAVPPGHVLLAYRLAEGESTLWALTSDDLQSFRLPGRPEIELLAREAREQLRGLSWNGMPPGLCRLSEQVLGPAVDAFRGRSLILVPDGALEAIPFAALPLPGACPSRQAPPLVTEHEISQLPSASLLAEPRPARLAEDDGRWITLVADPVYEATDPRLPKTDESVRSGADDGFQRLPRAGDEARSVLSLVPEHRRFALLGTEARRESVLDGPATGARILHFATHGVYEPGQPLRSHLVLSTFDGQGAPIPGRLFAYELYDLELESELVVLSGCDTGSGTYVPGEGAVSGLVRAFFYAGAGRVLASLWSVPDTGTSELMTRFYRSILEEELSPAQALSRAQKELWGEGLPPRAWAGFVLQGSPAPLAPFLP